MAATATAVALERRAPAELTAAPLVRLGEGIGRVVYASPNWIVRRDRSPSEVVALIVIWKLLRNAEHLLPGGLGARLLRKPSAQIRMLRVATQAAMAILPKSLWLTTHVRQAWSLYRRRSLRGERLAEARLGGTAFVPERVTFPSTRVRIAGWPGWLVVSEAVERVEMTLHTRLVSLARAGRFDEVELWLERFLDLRQSGWKLGVFSVDAHLKNFGVHHDRIVLLDAGGLTDQWHEIESKLAFEEVVTQPHIRLGLGPVLGGRPDLARRFDQRWKSIVNREVVRSHWPA